MSWFGFLCRNLLRNPLRSLLTGGAIALAFALVCFLATMPDGMNRILEQVATNTRVVVHNEAGLVYPLPYAYLQKVRTMPGVVAPTANSLSASSVMSSRVGTPICCSRNDSR